MAETEHWHLDRKVPISIIFALVTQATLGLWAVADIKKDVEILKTQIMVQRDRDERQDKASTELVGQIRTDLRDMNSKLDRLIERPRK